MMDGSMRGNKPYGRRKSDRVPKHLLDLSRHILGLIVVRTLILLLVLNLAYPIGLLPARAGAYPFLAFFNALTAILALAYGLLWWSRRQLRLQLYVQIGIDLIMTTFLVAQTRGIESVFISFYLLIIIYCSLTLGRNGGMAGAALCTILYSGIVAADHLGLLDPGSSRNGARDVTFRISVHAIGFFAVAYLGTYLSQRLRKVQEQLDEKIDSIQQLQSLNDHIVSSIRSGLITTDLQGKIASFNSTAGELTGRDGSAMIGKPAQEIIGEDLWREIIKSDFFRDARPLRHEQWTSLPGGSQRFLGLSISPLVDKEQRLLGYIISFQDLTEIKRLEEEIRVKDRMAAIGRMAAGLAHEIRNPLASMRGSVEILRSRVNLPKTDERLLDILIRESDRLNRFIEDFLQFARPATHTREKLDLVPLLHDSVTLLQNNPEVRSKHDLLLNVESPQIRVFGNAGQLQQVFWNLSQNAIRAMPGGGSLRISACADHDGGARITFEDTGIGMTPDDRSRLFQPFNPGFKGGTGLGLSIVFQIVEDHRGKISLESEKGRGTKVSLYLPPEKQADVAAIAG